MIRVMTGQNERCKKCPLFEAEVKKSPTTYLNGNLVGVNIDIFCKHRFICKHYIEK